MRVLILIMLLTLTGCKERSKWVVKCDSGFETQPSYGTTISEGVIHWRVTKRGQVHYRKMLQGEICQDIRVTP